MKKAMKLVWMVLFALPMISLTACGDDDDLIDDNTGISINMKDYSDLLDKTRDDVMKKMNMDVADSDNNGIYYENVENGVPEVDVYYTFFEDNEYGAQQTYEKSVMVDVLVDGFPYNDLLNFVINKYGKGNLNNEGIYLIKKGDMYVWLEWDDEYEDGYITFVKKSEWDKVYGALDTKAGESNFIKMIRERRAARK